MWLVLSYVAYIILYTQMYFLNHYINIFVVKKRNFSLQLVTLIVHKK